MIVVSWGMDIQPAWNAWTKGWRCLLRPDDVPGYPQLSMPLRWQLSTIASLALVKEPRSRWLLWAGLAGMLLARTVAWQLDLAGVLRDLLLLTPALVVVPWLATWRRRALIRCLRRRHPGGSRAATV